MKRTGPTNPQLQHLIKELKRASAEQEVAIWKRVATELEKPSRQRPKVNIYHIEKVANNGDTILVPGKVLSTGELSKQVTVAAWSFSDQAKTKIKDHLSIHDLLKKQPKGSNVRIIC